MKKIKWFYMLIILISIILLDGKQVQAMNTFSLRI